MDKQPGDAEDSGSSCTKWYSDVKAAIDTRPDSVVMIVVQAQRTASLADETLYFSGEAASGSQMMTQEVMVAVAGLPRILGRSVREPCGAD